MVSFCSLIRLSFCLFLFTVPSVPLSVHHSVCPFACPEGKSRVRLYSTGCEAIKPDGRSTVKKALSVMKLFIIIVFCFTAAWLLTIRMKCTSQMFECIWGGNCYTKGGGIWSSPRKSWTSRLLPLRSTSSTSYLAFPYCLSLFSSSSGGPLREVFKKKISSLWSSACSRLVGLVVTVGLRSWPTTTRVAV